MTSQNVEQGYDLRCQIGVIYYFHKVCLRHVLSLKMIEKQVTLLLFLVPREGEGDEAKLIEYKTPLDNFVI